MTAQFDTQTQDTEVEDISETIGDLFQTAFDVLIERRDSRYAAATESLESERVALESESASIEETRAGLEQLLPAQARESQRAADQLLLGGKHKAAAATLEKQRQAEGALAAMRERQREISARIEAIDEETKSIARAAFDSWYTELQAVIRSVERGLFLELLDNSHDFLAQWGGQYLSPKAVGVHPGTKPTSDSSSTLTLNGSDVRAWQAPSIRRHAS